MKVYKRGLFKWYEDMLLWRKFEDKLAALYIGQKSEDFYIYIMVRKQFLQVLCMQWT
jgi:TPP-dependent pyruvate/acetoin dehydrogenase alpha subunit